MSSTKIDSLIYDEHNFNTHTADGMALLEKSVERNGFGRSVLVDKNLNIIAGNGVVEAARKQGKEKIKVVKTTGDELVVVQRTDLDINTKEGRDMAYADNAVAAANLNWNNEELEYARETWGLDTSEWGEAEPQSAVGGGNYSRKIEVPIYEPKKTQQPGVTEMYDDAKARTLIQEIDAAELPKDVSEFLRLAAYRHVVFDYETIAEYYCHASKEVQELFEKSALVIIDMDKAIENGYVKFCKDIIDQYKAENEEQ